MSNYMRGSRVAPEPSSAGPPPPETDSAGADLPDPSAPRDPYRRRSSRSAPNVPTLEDAAAGTPNGGSGGLVIEKPSVSQHTGPPTLSTLLQNVPTAPNHTRPKPERLSATPILGGSRRHSNLSRMQSQSRQYDIDGHGETTGGLPGLNRMKSETGRRASLAQGGKSERRLSIQTPTRAPSQSLVWQDSVWDLDDLEANNNDEVISSANSAGFASHMEDVFMFLRGAISRPLSLFASLLVLGILLFCGIYGVTQAAGLARGQERQKNDLAATHVESAVNQGLDQLLSGLLGSSSDALRLDASLDLRAAFVASASGLMLQGRQRAAAVLSSAADSPALYDDLLALPFIRRAWLAPGGTVRDVQAAADLSVPLTEFQPQSNARLFDAASPLGLQSFSLALSTNDATTRPAYGVASPRLLSDGKYVYEFVSPIFLAPQDIAGWTPSAPYPSATECPSCRTKGFWGFVGASVDVSSLLDWAREHLADGKRMEVALMQGEGVEEVNLEDPARPRKSHVRCTVGVVTSRAQSPSVHCTAWIRDPSIGWEVAMIIVSTVVAVVLGVSYMLLASSRAEYWELLSQMLPSQALKSIRRGENPVEFFAGTTILFLDICNFTVLSKSMGPIDLVQLLNELYTYYDEIAERYEGLYKLDQIGDCYMLCAGCPYRLEPVEAARRASHFALDLIIATRSFVSSKGHKVSVRVGLNTGSVVGCIIGQARPKYSIFGNAVNKASRIESTSNPMHVQVSDSTAELLKRTGEFVLVESKADLKGIGTERTYFITREGDEDFPSSPGEATSPRGEQNGTAGSNSPGQKGTHDASVHSGAAALHRSLDAPRLAAMAQMNAAFAQLQSNLLGATALQSSSIPDSVKGNETPGDRSNRRLSKVSFQHLGASQLNGSRDNSTPGQAQGEENV